jgi:uncharacterized protein YvpB
LNKERLDKLVTLKTPETSDIIKFLEKNIPVIINVNVSAFRKTEPNNRGHIIVITDYKNGKFFYNDSSINYGGKHVIEHDHLMFCWGANALTSSAYLLAVWR